MLITDYRASDFKIFFYMSWFILYSQLQCSFVYLLGCVVNEQVFIFLSERIESSQDNHTSIMTSSRLFNPAETSRWLINKCHVWETSFSTLAVLNFSVARGPCVPPLCPFSLSRFCFWGCRAVLQVRSDLSMIFCFLRKVRFCSECDFLFLS